VEKLNFYNMIPLENVTIISINGRDPENSVKAINYSSRRIKFAKKILVTTPDKVQKYDDIEVFEYDMKNRDIYSYFCIKELYKYIDTDFCLDKRNWNHKLWASSKKTCPEVSNNYFNTNIDPYEVMFFKNIRHPNKFRNANDSGIPDYHIKYLNNIFLQK